MSPAVNLDLEDVPFAILEVVKARILANRARLGQSKPRPSTRPRPQFRKTGASSKGWRKPQHGAGALEDSFIARLRDDFVDTGDYAHPVQSSGYVSLSDQQVAEGANSFHFYGGVGLILVDQNSAPAIGTGDFTVAMWVRETPTEVWLTLVTLPGEKGATIDLAALYMPMQGVSSLNTDSHLSFWVNTEPEEANPFPFELLPDGGQIPGRSIVHQQGIPKGTMTHICVMRRQGVIRLYTNGVRSNADFSFAQDIPQGTWAIGAWPLNLEDFSFNGYLDDIIIDSTNVFDWDGFAPSIP